MVDPSDETLSESEALIVLQEELLDQAKKELINYKKTPIDRRFIQAHFRRRLGNLDELRTDFIDNHRKIITLNAAKDHDYFKNKLRDVFTETYTEAYTFIQSEYDTHFPPTPPPPVATSTLNANPRTTPPTLEVKLPHLNLPSFDGNLAEWASFNDAFEHAVEKQNFTSISKFRLLKSCLRDEAELLIRHIPISDANYQIAYDLLRENYADKKALFNSQMETFISLPDLKTENPIDIRQLINIARSCMRAVSELGIAISEELFVFLILKKLPNSTRSFCLQSFTGKDIPKWDDLDKVIKSRIAALNALPPKTEAKGQSNFSPSNKKPSSNSRNDSSADTRKSFKSFHATTKPTHCPMCSEFHVIRKCSAFLKLSVTEREAIVDKHKLCRNCLSSGHIRDNCLSSKNCITCGGRHHTLIHPSKPATAGNTKVLHVNTPCSQFHAKQILLATAIIRIKSINGGFIQLRALLDQGSQATLITESAVQRLGLPRTSIRACINGIGDVQTETSKHYVSIVIGSCHNSNYQFTTDAFVLTTLTSVMPNTKIPMANWPHLTSLTLADPTFLEPGHIDVLLGADAYANILLPGLLKGDIGTPIAQNSVLGWIVSGNVAPSSSVNSATIQISSFHLTTDTNDILQKFWEIEEVPSERKLTPENEWCTQFFTQTHQRQPNGKFLVKLPLKTYLDPSQTLGRSYQTALNNFHQLERRFQRDPVLFDAYSTAIDEWISSGHMVRENTTENNHKMVNEHGVSYNCCFLPHHPVFKETSSTTKLRIVFNASAKTSNGKSLNDIQYTGPSLQNDLVGVITNWRFWPYVFTADMEKMYRRVDLDIQDSFYQLILWRSNPNQDMQVFRIGVVMFGSGSAAYLAIQCICQLAEDEKDNYPLFLIIVQGCLYVDDVFAGGFTMEQAQTLKQQTINCLRSGGFELRKWATNTPEIITDIPIEHREIKNELNLHDENSIKTLGIYWQPSDDHFHFKINFDINVKIITKRSVLSTIARLFDPLGWINPIVVTAKVFLKRLWQEGLDWDDTLPIEFSNDWLLYLESLEEIANIKIPRWIQVSSPTQKMQLHTFCDGSLIAYSAATYLRVSDSHGHHVNLLMAKCKITPKKQLTIPRIELCAAVLAVKLFKFIISNINIFNIEFSSYFWTDSSIVLSWIRGDPNRWKTFVCNRICTILQTSTVCQWHHISTHDNPADCSSRGATTKQLINHPIWWHGPPWLRQEEQTWPKTVIDTANFNVLDDEEASEMKKNYVHTISIKFSSNIISSHSNLHRLQRHMAWCLRFINNASIKRRSRESSTLPKPIFHNYLTLVEYRQSIKAIHRMVQHEHFASEIHCLQNSDALSPKSQLIALNPYLDTDGILRVGGRLRNSSLSYHVKHPVILPENHHFTNLIIEHNHLITLHGGCQLTLNQIRQQHWIVHGKRVVSNFIRKCIKCFKNKPPSTTQLMGDLPSARVRPSRPFSSTGVDYAGPIDFRVSKGRGNKSYKGYIAVFVCLSTKAIHLEPVSDLTTAAFRAALDRFFARRGFAHDIYSDCGTNFIGADNILKENAFITKSQMEIDLLPHLTLNSVNWHFNPPSSPHFGGLWEAGVKSMKHHLKRIIPNSTLTYEEMTTLLCKIESCLNSRPLCPLSNDTDELAVLTPGHFLIGDALLSPPEKPVENLNLTNRWHLLQKLTNDFWHKWSTEYLVRLQSRPKWLRTENNIEINDLVLIRDERLPPNQWLLGRVVELHKGKDDLVRVVTVKTKNGQLKRPIVKLSPLPMQNEFKFIDDSLNMH